MAKQIFSSERTSEEYVLLNSCGIQHFIGEGGTCLREKGRVDYHILYIAKGCCYLHKKEQTSAVTEGHVILFRPHEKQHYTFKAEDSSVSYYMHFTGIGCPSLLSSLHLDSEVTYVGKNPHFETVFAIMLREYTLKQYACDCYCSGLLLELFSILSRGAFLGHTKAGRDREAMIMQAQREIYEHLGRVSIDEIAAKYYLSRSRFSHIFKEVTGMSPLEYVMHMRLQRAKDMLLHTDLPIRTIAAESGYPDQNYFSRVFRRETGMSPQKFRS